MFDDEVFIGFDSEEDIKEFKYNKRVGLMNERWKKVIIEGKDSGYRVSNTGKLKKKNGKIIDGYSQRDKYVHVKISDKNYSVHRLVAYYFCIIPKRHKNKSYDELCVNHKDGNTKHNASFNLEWCTPKENTTHAWETGLCSSIQGEKTHLAKMSEETAIQIINLIMIKKTNNEILKELSDCDGISLKAIQHIRSKESWKYLSKNLKFPKLGTSTPFSISDDTIHDICKILELKKYKDPEIAKMFNVKRELVKDIRTKRRRTNISKFYNI